MGEDFFDGWTVIAEKTALFVHVKTPTNSIIFNVTASITFFDK